MTQSKLREAVGCPRCYSQYIHTATPRTLLERAMARVGVQVRRCRQCAKRFYF